MKKNTSKILILIVLLALCSGQLIAEEKPKIKSVCLKNENSLSQPSERGGLSPFLQSCIFGPRIGLEANEGKPVQLLEIVNAFVLPGIPLIYPIKAFIRNGIKGGFYGCCIGPRVGMQADVRKARDIELLSAIPVLGLYPRFTIAWEAYKGRTMSEIEREENLKK